jgi:hypothetical protein
VFGESTHIKPVKAKAVCPIFICLSNINPSCSNTEPQYKGSNVCGSLGPLYKDARHCGVPFRRGLSACITAYSGMSTMVVTPPAAAALVAVQYPSHSVRPGSFTCT